jgi:hypothetical protein
MGKASFNLTRNRTRLHSGAPRKIVSRCESRTGFGKESEGERSGIIRRQFCGARQVELFFEVGHARKKTEFENGLAETAKAPRQAADEQ